MNFMKLILANPRGFCSGVKRAIQAVEQALLVYGAPVYLNHQIVHNDYVAKELEKKGAFLAKDIGALAPGSVLIISAHGTSPDFIQKAQKMGLRVINATCPLVAKVHLAAQNFSKKGYAVLLIGHKNHPEVLGVMGECEIILIETLKDIEKLNLDSSEKIACLTQTTLSLNDTRELLKALTQKYPQVITSPRGDICRATQNRQEAMLRLAKNCDLILVAGSKASSNSNRLAETARENGAKSYLINDLEDLKKLELDFENKAKIGLTAGASTPQVLIAEIIDYFKENFRDVRIEELAGEKEEVAFRGVEMA